MTQEQRDGLNDAALALTEPIIEELLKDISRRIKKAGAITDTAEYEIYRAQALGESKKTIAAAIARQMEISEEVIDALLDYVVDTSAKFEDNAYLQQLVEGYREITKNKTAEQLKNLWATAPDGGTVPLQDAYAKAMDFAFRHTAAGVMDLNTAIRRAVEPLARRGLRTIEQKNGRSVGIEYACRRYLMDQMGQMDNAIQQQNHDRLGCNGWEISAHSACAPDHEPIQGRQYTDEEFETLNASLQRPIGRLNCRHVADPVLIGVDTPVHSEEELDQMAADNEVGVTYNGKHYTLYQAGQEQAAIENALRRMRRQVLVDEESGSEDLQKHQIRLRVLQSEYNRFCHATGRRTRTERLYTAGFDHSHASKAVWTYRKKNGVYTDELVKIHKITKESIDNIPIVKLEGMTQQQADNLREAHKMLLSTLRDKPTGVEAGASFAADCIVRQNDVIIGKEGSVRVQTYAASVGTMHTHPTATPFSVNDVAAFLMDEKLQMATVVGNNGSVFVLRKKPHFDAAAVIHLWDRLEKEMPDWKSSAEKLLAIRRRFLKGMEAYGFEYHEFQAQ